MNVRADLILRTGKLDALFIPVRMEQPLKSFFFFHDQSAPYALWLF